MDLFVALADPARQRIIDILASGEHTAGQLAAVVGGELRISRTAVSKHLRILREAGLVDVRADNQWRWYHIASAGIADLEASVDDLKRKLAGAIGWDAENGCKFDPLASGPHTAVPFRGPGRPRTPSRRGRQTTSPIASDPEHGLYVVPPDPEPGAFRPE